MLFLTHILRLLEGYFMKDTFEKFNFPTVGFHWIIAIAMIAMLAFGLYLEELPRSAEKGQLIGLHKSFGVMVFGLALLRIIWRIKNKFPAPLSTLTSWQAKLAKFTHWFLIIGTALMPISGVVMTVGSGRSVSVFGLELIAGSGDKIEALSNVGHIMHGLGGRLLILFIVLHAVAAIKHQFFDKDGTLTRMVGGRVKANSDKV